MLLGRTNTNGLANTTSGPSFCASLLSTQLAYASMQEVVQSILPHTTDFCSLEVIPLPASSVIDARRHMQWLGMLRIRITHARGLEQPAGPSEERALKELEVRLQELGISSQGGRA